MAKRPLAAAEHDGAPPLKKMELIRSQAVLDGFFNQGVSSGGSTDVPSGSGSRPSYTDISPNVGTVVAVAPSEVSSGPSVPLGQPHRDDLDGAEQAGYEDLASLQGHEGLDGEEQVGDEEGIGRLPSPRPLVQDRQPDTSPSPHLTTRDGAQFDLELNQWRTLTTAAVDNKTGLSLFEHQLGERLNEQSAGKAMELMASIAMQHGSGKKSVDLGKLTEVERKHFERLDMAAKAGSFDTKSYLGNQFRDFLKQSPEDMSKYKAMNRADAAIFRAGWVTDKMDKWCEQRRETTAWSRIDTTKGQHKNFARVVKEWGGWRSEEAIRGAVAACQQCLCMGPPWIQVHPQSGLTEFLILDFGYTENFKQAWEHFREERTEGTAAVTGETKTTVQAAIAGKIETSAQVNTVGTPAGRKKAKEDGQDQAATKTSGKDPAATKTPQKTKAEKGVRTIVVPEKLDAAGLWREATKLKTKYQQASSSFVEVDRLIRTDLVWEHFKGNVHGRMLSAQEKLKSMTTAWHRDFVISSEVSVIKKTYSTANCEMELLTFLKLANLIDSLAVETLKVINAQRELTR